MFVYTDAIADDAQRALLVGPRAGDQLTLALSLQVHHTHVDDGSQVGEGLHDLYVGVAVISFHIELNKTSRRNIETLHSLEQIDRPNRNCLSKLVFFLSI